MSWTRRFPVALAVTALAAVVASGACTDDGGDDRSAASTGDEVGEVSASTTDPAPQDTTPPADALRIPEQGFSVFAHPRTGRPTMTVGLVVENTSQVSFASTVVMIHLYDGSGAEVLDDLGAPLTRGITIGHLGPGEAIGVGDTFGIAIAQTPVDRIEPRIGELPGQPSVEDDPPRGELTVVRSEAAGDPDCPRVDITVASTYEGALPRALAYVVYRDQSGKIVGGAEGSELAIPAPGEARTEVAPEACPAGAVPGVARTDASIDRGTVSG